MGDRRERVVRKRRLTLGKVKGKNARPALIEGKCRFGVEGVASEIQEVEEHWGVKDFEHL